MGALRVEIAHGLFPCPRRVFIGHGQHPFDEGGDGLRIPCLFLGRLSMDVRFYWFGTVRSQDPIISPRILAAARQKVRLPEQSRVIVVASEPSC